MYTYDIYIDPLHYSVSLNSSDAKVVWEKDSESALFRRKLDGTFSINNSGNESLFSKLLDLTYCQTGILTVSRDGVYVISGAFMKKDLSVNIDKCFIEIKFDKYDLYVGIDELLDKDFDIIKGNPYKPYGTHKVRYEYDGDFEYFIGTGTVDFTSWYDTNGYLDAAPTEDFRNNIFFPTSPDTYIYPMAMPISERDTLTLYKNEVTLSGAYIEGGINTFVVTSYWVRAVRSFRRVGDTVTVAPIPDPADCNSYVWVFIKSITETGGDIYDIFGRGIPTDVETHNLLDSEISKFTVIAPLTCAEDYHVNINRGRKLNDVIDSMIFNAFPSGFKSEFFRDVTNPISGKDLSNIMIYQKSDCITPSSSDPALRGIITFRKLMGYLRDMFNVQWAIDSNGDLRIEHRKYWDNGETYDTNTVGIDLTLEYPQSLIGTSAYTYDSSIPIQEKFEFNDAISLDFYGSPINYSPCILKGDTIIYSLNEINTDISSIYLNTDSSKEGFCLVHCESKPTILVIIDGVTYYYYNVIEEIGKLSNKSIVNGHLSNANLQDAYWKYGRYLPKGIMNNVSTDFDVASLMYQKEIIFPYCYDEFNPHKMIRTKLGDGNVKSASYSLKTNWLTVELKYKDSI